MTQRVRKYFSILSWLYISGVDIILVWNPRQNIDRHTHTHPHTIQNMTYLHSCRLSESTYVSKKIEGKKYLSSKCFPTPIVVYFEKIISSLHDNEMQDF